MEYKSWPGTGIANLDRILSGLRKGDNVVFQLDNIDDFASFAKPFTEHILKQGKKVNYIRFASHPSVLQNDPRINIFNVDAREGFESFTKNIHEIITAQGRQACYVFDCLSELLSAWGTDVMIGNFFSVTCPYLFELDTIAYFAIMRERHSFKTVAGIRETTQLLLDVYNCGGNVYLHPLKVWNRYSTTMFLPHIWQGDEFLPLTSSTDSSKLFTHICARQTDGLQNTQGARRNLDYWDQLFLDAEAVASEGPDAENRDKTQDLICGIMLAKDSKMASLIKRHLRLEDMLTIKNRLAGTGFIGGKSAGMLVARAILQNDADLNWDEYLEPHDSYFIGSDVFYAYIVQNGLWKLFMRHKTPEGYFTAAGELREKILAGRFSEEIKEQFYQIIEYFGQSPIIIRSSSLLEDSYGNAFAGKYESIFLGNQGRPELRFEEFESAVRKVFASAFGEDALIYRRQRGLDILDEQMALLVQRVSGAHRKSYFFPDSAGVGVSYNTFAWNPQMDLKAGMIRIVAGLGTRAVGRNEQDYPLLVALDNPLMRPDSTIEALRSYSQKKADIINIEKNCLQTIEAEELLENMPQPNLSFIAVRDENAEKYLVDKGISGRKVWLITFEKLLSETGFARVMRLMLKKLEETYSFPVEIEFTLNFEENGKFHINLLQCRPFQAKAASRENVAIPENIDKSKIIFSSSGGFMGGSIKKEFNRIIYVDPKEYSLLPTQKKYEIARIIGGINRHNSGAPKFSTMLAGPGRWGTTTPSMGVPVNFSDIHNVRALIELEFKEADITPELSYGSHFFHDLVESDIFYCALFAKGAGQIFNAGILLRDQNELAALNKDYAPYENVILLRTFQGNSPVLLADLVSQKVLCFLNG